MTLTPDERGHMLSAARNLAGLAFKDFFGWFWTFSRDTDYPIKLAHDIYTTSAESRADEALLCLRLAGVKERKAA